MVAIDGSTIISGDAALYCDWHIWSLEDRGGKLKLDWDDYRECDERLEGKRDGVVSVD